MKEDILQDIVEDVESQLCRKLQELSTLPCHASGAFPQRFPPRSEKVHSAWTGFPSLELRRSGPEANLTIGRGSIECLSKV